MEGKLKILSGSKCFTCESNIWYGGYSQTGRSQTLDKTHFEKDVVTELLKFKWSILVKPNHTSKDAPCVLVQRRNTVAQWNDTASFSCILQTSAGLFCLWTYLCTSTNSLIFSALAVQITIPKYKEIAGQFYPLLQWAKHINKTYVYFNLLLIISAADKTSVSKR